MKIAFIQAGVWFFGSIVAIYFLFSPFKSLELWAQIICYLGTGLMIAAFIFFREWYQEEVRKRDKK